MENLDTIASQAMESDTLTADDKSAETNTESKVTAPQETATEALLDTQATRKSSRRDVENKRYEDLRAFTDRKNNEYVAKIKALEDRVSKYSDIDPLLPQIKQALEQRKQEELAQRYQANPIAVNKQMMQEMLNQTIAPFQQQAQMAEIKQTVNDNISYMKQTYGEDAFRDVSPIMKDMLDRTSEELGPEVASLLASKPDHLFMAAFGHLAYQKIREFNAQKQAGTQNKQNLAKVAAGVSRPNRTTRTNTDNSSREAIEQNAFDFLEGKI